MRYYKNIFVVLVYKNMTVLRDFFEGFSIDNSHIIVVNSFFNEQTKQECSDIATQYGASFINIPNKGYGYGNNIGISYALKNFLFDFIIISNSDIIIKKWEGIDKYKNKDVVLAPQIIATSLNNKNQNPNLVKISKRLYFNPLKDGYLNHKQWKIHLAHIYSRLTRELFHLNRKVFGQRTKEIFSAHGAFIIITSVAVQKLMPVFNESMFLYNEELYLAFRCKEAGIKIIYDNSIKVLHLEGASSSSVNEAEEFKSFKVLHDYLINR